MSFIPLEYLEKRILLIRGKKVLLSIDLSEIYEVEPRALTQAVKRNIGRFPSDFMSQLTADELNSLRSQNVTLKKQGKGEHFKHLPYAFTQEGVAMLSRVLKSTRAVEANIAIMRTFVKLRELMISHHDLSEKIERLERRYDSQFKVIFKSIKELTNVKPKELIQVPIRRKIGFGND